MVSRQPCLKGVIVKYDGCSRRLVVRWSPDSGPLWPVHPAAATNAVARTRLSEDEVKALLRDFAEAQPPPKQGRKRRKAIVGWE